MADYRLNVLGLREEEKDACARKYGHVLPKHLRCLNILEGFRSDFFNWLESGEKLKFHKSFNHLNSSQAACINLLFPLVRSVGFRRVISALLGIGEISISQWEFEKVIDPKEGTNFDFYLRLESGSKVYVEFKYSETEFGKAKNNKTRRTKLREIYEPRLNEKVTKKYLEEKCFFENYQVLRNLVYFQPKCGDFVIFMYPKGNKKLSTLPCLLDDMIPDQGIRNAVKIRYLEDAVDDAMTALECGDGQLRKHFDAYSKKYLSLDLAVKSSNL